MNSATKELVLSAPALVNEVEEQYVDPICWN